MRPTELGWGVLIVILAGLLFTAMNSIPRARGAGPSPQNVLSQQEGAAP